MAPGAVGPATLEGTRYSSPDHKLRPRSALRTGTVRHSGGISLSAGGTTVKLTDFHIKLLERKLYGKVDVAGPVALLDLDYSRLRIKLRGGRVQIGPSRPPSPGTADALNQAFGVNALTDDTPLGDATIRYRLF